MDSNNIMTMLREGGTQMLVPGGKSGKTFKAQTQSGIIPIGAQFPLTIDGETIPVAELVGLRECLDFDEHLTVVRDLGFDLLVKRAKVGQSKHVRVRPIFREWTLTGKVEITDEAITLDIFERILALSGTKKGLGRLAPQFTEEPGAVRNLYRSVRGGVMTNVFMGGVPTDIDVEKIRKAVIPEPGVLVPYSVLAAVTELDPKSCRFTTVVRAWRNELRREKNLLTEGVRNEGIMVLAPNRRVDHVGRGTRKGVRALQRARAVAVRTERDGLAPERIRALDHNTRLLGSMLNLGKEIEDRERRSTPLLPVFVDDEEKKANSR